MEPFRSDVVGSLLRPDYLKEARARHEAGELNDAAVQARSRIARWTRRSRCRLDAGLDVITDGEMRRYAFFGHLIDAVEGFDKLGGWAIPFHDEQGNEMVFQRPVVVSRLKRRRHMCAEEFAYLRARAAERAGKVTLINAQQAAAYYDAEKSHGAYADDRRLPGRCGRYSARRGGRADPPRLHLHPARRAAIRRAARPGHPRGLSPARQRPRPAARPLHRTRQRGHRRSSRRHLRHPPLPRQQPEQVLRERRLRPDRRAGLPAHPLRALPARIRRRALGRLRAVAHVPEDRTSCSAW